MTYRRIRLVLLAICAVGVMPFAAQAQWYGGRQAPLYPDQLQPGQTYAVEVAPGTYVFHRPRSHKYPHVPSSARHHAVRRHADKRGTDWRSARRVHTLPHRRDSRRVVINAERIVREKPVVIEHRREVNDPPRVVERREYVEDVPTPPRRAGRTSKVARELPRVIHADAEVTILGPDRMSIKLYRKRSDRKEAFDKK